MANEKYRLVQDPHDYNNYTIELFESLWDGKKDTDMVYLSDFLQELPNNCVFLKGVTGCGATSLALADRSHCIIALPTRNTVQSKWVIRDKGTREIIGYDNDIFPIYGGFNDTKDALIKYLNSRNKEHPIKIVCTYDQVERLYMRLTGKIEDGKGGYVQDEAQNALCVNATKFRLYVDEIHQVLDDYKTPERRASIRGLLRTIAIFNKHENTTCITATPLERKYFFDEIKDLRVINVDYEGFFAKNPRYEDYRRKVDLRKCGYLAPAVIKIVREHLEGRAFGNAHIFVNSVDFIAKKILKPLMEEYADFDTFRDDIRVVCGDTETNERKIKKAVSALFKDKDVISIANEINVATEVDNAIMEQMREYAYYGDFVASINSPTKKVNFYTKTAWLGADVFDKTGQIYIVSDGARKHTMADISTAYIQILGRIRDSQNNKVIHLYSENRYISEDGEELTAFEKDMENRDQKRIKYKGFAENLTKEEKKEILKLDVLESACYLALDEETGNLEYDKYLKWNDEISYKIVNGQYRNGANMTKEMLKNGWDVSENDETQAEKLKRKANTRVTFQKLYEDYARLKEGSSISLFADVPAMVELLEAREEYLHDAYHLLGDEVVKALGYKRREIAREVEMRRNADLSANITRLLNLRIKVGETYTNAEIDAILRSIEQKLHLKRKLKITDYYETESVLRRWEEGVSRGKKIIRHKSRKGET